MSVEHIDSVDNQNSDQLFSFGQTETDHWILSIDQAFPPVNFEVGSNLQYYLSLQSPDENAPALEKRFKILMTDVDMQKIVTNMRLKIVNVRHQHGNIA